MEHRIDMDAGIDYGRNVYPSRALRHHTSNELPSSNTHTKKGSLLRHHRSEHTAKKSTQSIDNMHRITEPAINNRFSDHNQNLRSIQSISFDVVQHKASNDSNTTQKSINLVKNKIQPMQRTTMQSHFPSSHKNVFIDSKQLAKKKKKKSSKLSRKKPAKKLNSKLSPKKKGCGCQRRTLCALLTPLVALVVIGAITALGVGLGKPKTTTTVPTSSIVLTFTNTTDTNRTTTSSIRTNTTTMPTVVTSVSTANTNATNRSTIVTTAASTTMISTSTNTTATTTTTTTILVPSSTSTTVPNTTTTIATTVSTTVTSTTTLATVATTTTILETTTSINTTETTITTTTTSATITSTTSTTTTVTTKTTTSTTKTSTTSKTSTTTTTTATKTTTTTSSTSSITTATTSESTTTSSATTSTESTTTESAIGETTTAEVTTTEDTTLTESTTSESTSTTATTTSVSKTTSTTSTTSTTTKAFCSNPSPPMNPCTSGLYWNIYGYPYAGNGVAGVGWNQFKAPYALWIDSNDTLYVSDSTNYRIMSYLRNASNGTLVAGTGTTGALLNQTSNSIRFNYVDGNGSIYFVDSTNHRVMRWPIGGNIGTVVAGNGTSGATLSQLASPQGVWVDSSGNVFVADTNNHRVVKWAPSATAGILVAGGTGQGSTTNKLFSPAGLYYDEPNDDLYISNFGASSTVMKWHTGAPNGTFVAGIPGNAGSNSSQLNTPAGITFDQWLNLYVADRMNGRVQLFCNGTKTGITIAGRTTGANNFTNLYDIKLDSLLNLYLVDYSSPRVIKFCKF